MIHLIYGNSRDKVLARSKEIVDENLRSNPGALYFKITDDSFEEAKLEELIDGRSLFSHKIIILCDGLFSDVETLMFVSKNIEKFSLSNNLFVFREGILDKSRLEFFKNSSSSVEEFTIERGDKSGYYEGFNIFSFTDALGSRDRKLAWVLFHKAIRAGIPAEEIFWKSVWLFKNIILVSSINTNQDDLVTKLKISPFVIKKSKSFLKNYSDEILRENHRRLVDIYHQFRRGALEISMAMEKFILNL